MSGGEDHEGDGARRCYSWMAAVKTKLESCKAEEVRAPPPTIVKVPRIIRRNNDQAYDPHLLSIGPYHRRPEPRLAPMEKLKWKYLRDFCARNDDESAALDVLLRKIQEVKDPARNCYSQDQIPVRDDDEFGEMLLLDACFVLELFLKSHEKIKRHSRLHDTDLVLASSSECALRSVARDLLLVENQLPFFVLRHIFDSSPKSPLSPVSLETLVVEFFKPLYQTINKMESSRKKTGEDDAVLHILHLIHSHFMESSKTQKDFDVSLSILPDLKTPPLLPLQTVPSAKRLQEAGIRFERRKTGNSFLDVTFSEELGVMEIPHLVVDHYTNTFLRNIIAFEQVNPMAGKCFTFYAAFMDFIVNTAQDVEILLQSGIIDHGLGSDKNIASMFNMMCKGLIVESEGNDRYHRLTRDVMAYYRTPWNMWRAKLNRDYFSNPWAIISFSAGVLAICLTLLNTFYNVYRYYHPSP